MWPLELADHLASLAQAICSHSETVAMWYVSPSIILRETLITRRAGEELVDICMGLTAAHLPVQIIRFGVDVILLASTCEQRR